MSDLLMLQGTWLGSQGGVVETLEPQPKTSRIAYIPKRRRDLPWQLPKEPKVEEVRPVVHGSGGTELPLPVLRGRARVITRHSSGGKAVLALPSVAAFGRVHARAGGGAALIVPKLAGAGGVDESELALEEALGIEDIR